jgi:hypothetical protein
LLSGRCPSSNAAIVLANENVPLAAVAYQRGFEIDGLLLACCAELRSWAFCIGGFVQRSPGAFGQCATGA